MKVDGGCHCGAVRYQAVVDPDKVVICHCSDCQRISGAPYRVNVPVLVENFALQGKPTTYVKRGDSGNEVMTAFCGTCGAALYSRRPEGAKFVHLRLGSVNQRSELAPKAQGFCRSAMPWAMDITGVRKIPEGPRPGRNG